jgi:hypothetical protein
MLTDDIFDLWKKVYRPGKNRSLLHNGMQAGLVDLAIKYKAHAIRKYTLLTTFAYENLDVVWVKDKKPFAAFEIDSSKKTKPVYRLYSISAPEKYWIYFGMEDNLEDFVTHTVEEWHHFSNRQGSPIKINVVIPGQVNFAIRPSNKKHMFETM